MNNLFLTQWFDWHQPQSRRLRWANSLLSKLGFQSRLTSPRSTGEQTSIEQRINLFHLATHCLIGKVPGTFVEIGSHRGSTAALLQHVIEAQRAPCAMHVYDAFMAASADELLANFRSLSLQPPVVHAGLFQETIPTQLPDHIAFAHLDANWGQSFDDHRQVIAHCLAGLYPRLAPGAICVVADYCEPDAYQRQQYVEPWLVSVSREWNQYPAVKAACDEFLAGKPETMTLLYGGGYSHGYFRKAAN